MQERYARRRVVATAALRSAVAWSRRDNEPRAWGEVARMTGVVMHAYGPGAGPTTPAQLVTSLGRPLAELLPPGGGQQSPLDAVVLLDADGVLSDEAMEIVCDYTQALFDSSEDPAMQWLPTWAWQRAEQIQRQLFLDLVQAGDATVYTASRRFLVEHPAGDVRELTDTRNEAGARQVARYVDIPRDRLFRFSPGEDGLCWWPCPVCRWPMRVHGRRVECTYRPHAARFLLNEPAAGAPVPPTLAKVSATRLGTPRPRTSAAAQCVEPAVWRFVTVPGVPELELERRLRSPDVGIDVVMYPIKDTFDALVTTPDGRSWSVDVKDHADPQRVIDDPPRAAHLVVPRYRKGQLNQLRRMLPGKSVWTVDGFCRHVRDHVTGGEGS